MKRKSLTFKFTLMFAAFILLTLAISSILSYLNQTRIYKQQREESVQFVASYLEELLISDDIYFIWYQDYFLKKAKDVLVPYDFDNDAVQDARHDYEEAISQDSPGMVLGTNIDFEDLSAKTKNAYEIYSHEYYQAAFEKARDMFNLAYIYYFVPNDDGTDEVTIVLDSDRTERIVNGKKYIDLGNTAKYPKESHERLWKAWETGKRPKGYDVFENQKGKTYAYYTPLFINGRKLGVIDVEINVSEIIHTIHMATLNNMIAVGSVLVIFSLFLLLVIRTNYIRKLVKLRDVIEDYSQNKDSSIAKQLKSEIANEDEISVIISKLADMIYELERYMKSLSRTAMALRDTKQKALEMSELAEKDSLTGIRNKTGYDKEVQKDKQEMDNGLKDLGVAMIDLNYLKKINDTYGHDKGNVAITSLCRIVCQIFDHSPVFRIGGDEFVVILKGHDLENIDNLITKFKRQLKELQDDPNLEYWEKTSAAIGYAVYNPEIDEDYESIFKRADAEMYKSKKEMKATRE